MRFFADILMLGRVLGSDGCPASERGEKCRQ